MVSTSMITDAMVSARGMPRRTGASGSWSTVHSGTSTAVWVRSMMAKVTVSQKVICTATCIAATMPGPIAPKPFPSAASTTVTTVPTSAGMKLSSSFSSRSQSR